ncbi:MAG: indolepyruvate ferredoxin oxidoreductase subunit alpha [Rhodocyclales bacterium]|nr:indolepyruvate ferredoxin oxidoreductase subunit alpha [Rhodocyclales bacterium]
MERSFKQEVELLRLGEGETFHGEGILAVTKALLQSGVSYVSGYQGAPISHLMDVLADAHEVLDDLGIHFETAANEAGAAAMLGASINYPLRGAVTWKSVVGTNVASDALSNLASAGVKGGALIVIGEDYGEGASIIQERTHAFAMKSQIWLLDPRPNLETIVRMVEKGFELSEASNTPVMLELRIRACHVHGSFKTRDNQPPRFSRNNVLENADFDYGRICLPPSVYAQEKHKVEVRMPAAVRFVRDQGLNEVFPGRLSEIGIIAQGGMYNGVIRALQQLGLADAFGESQIPLYVLNVTYPLIPEEITRFCAGKRAVLMVEEGQPAFIEESLNALLRRADLQTTIVGKDVLPMAGEYTGEVVLSGIAKFLQVVVPDGVDPARVSSAYEQITAPKRRAKELLSEPVPARPPGFCVGCPERPVFAAMKLVERESGGLHIAADIGCHTFSTLPPFNLGNSVLGYGLGLASSAGVAPAMGKRVISVMGDGGFWHNGITTGVANAVFNQDDSVLVIMKNGYTAATGDQNIPSSGRNAIGVPSQMDIEKTLRGLGVEWLKTVHTYHVGTMVKTLRGAVNSAYKGLKVIVADGECMLERSRREKPIIAQKLKAGERVVRTRFGVDEEVCTGDHSCIRLSGCPSLTIKPNPDPLRTDPVACVNNGCVGCGVCGEVAHAAVLCPSFYRTEIVSNPTALDRFLHRVRGAVIGWFQGGAGARPA